MNRILVGVSLLSLVLCVGCGGAVTRGSGEGNTDQRTTQENRDVAAIRTTLEKIASSGTISFSDLSGLPESLEKAGKSDLVKDVKKFQPNMKPDAAKKLAKDILAKL